MLDEYNVNVLSEFGKKYMYANVSNKIVFILADIFPPLTADESSYSHYIRQNSPMISSVLLNVQFKHDIKIE